MALITTPRGIMIEFRHDDFIPGMAAYLANEDGSFEASKPAFCSLNLEAFLMSYATEDLSREDLVTAITDSMLHEVGHVIEDWAGATFCEERIERLIDAYRKREAEAPDQGMDFSAALAFMRSGSRVRRQSWGEENKFWRIRGNVLLVGWTWEDGGEGECPHCELHEDDIMGDDWEIVE